MRELLILSLLPASCVSASTEKKDYKYPRGHPRCPCLSSWEASPIEFLNNSNYLSSEGGGDDTQEFIDDSIERFKSEFDWSAFGLDVCAPHELQLQTSPCQSQCSDESNDLLKPQPKSLIECDKSWCHRSFCYIDPDNCSLERQQSQIYKNRFWSYATCGEADAFTGLQRIQQWKGRTLNVSILQNSGGWMGSYSATGQHYMGPWSHWGGTTVDFIKDVAQEGGFELQLTRPPDFLEEQARDSIGSGDAFAQCIHATALGFIDLCIASFTINTVRATVANFVQIGTDDVYLIVNDYHGSNNDSFFSNLGKVFAPLKPETWGFMLFFVIPLLGLLTVFHEYGTSLFPKTRTISVVDVHTGNQKQEERRFPLWEHCLYSVYVALVAVLRGDYDVPVVSTGGYLNIVATLFFIRELPTLRLCFAISIFSSHYCLVVLTSHNKK